MSRQQCLVDCQTIKILRHDLVVDQAVKLIDHEAKSMKLLLRSVQMCTDILS